MTTDLLVPLLLPLLAWPVSRLTAPRLPPRAASRLLTGACLVLAGGSTLMFRAGPKGRSTLPESPDEGDAAPAGNSR